MTPYKLGWKVVGSGWYGKPCYQSSHKSTLLYSHYKKTKPYKGWGPLCVFTNRKDANRFLREYPSILGPLKVFPCAYIPSNKNFVWDGYGTKRPIGDLPEGKALASEVILLKERRIK